EIILNTLSNLENKILNFEKINYFPHGKINEDLQDVETTGLNMDQNLVGNVGEVLSIRDILELKIGDKIYHRKFGVGTILGIKESNGRSNTTNHVGQVQFEVGIKNLLLEFAKLRKVLN